MKTPLLPVALALLVALGCRASGTSRAGARIEYQQRVTFVCEASEPYRALQIENLGPGPVEVEFEGRDGKLVADSILPLTQASFPLDLVRRVTLVHADPAPAVLVWSASEALRGDIEVSVD